MDAPSRSSSDPVIDWLLDSDPSIRWQVMRDLTDTPEEIAAAERSRVASEGWGRSLLDEQCPDGQWGDGVTRPFWWSNLYSLLFLRDLGLDPTSAPARRAIDLVRRNVTWGPEFGNSPFFEGEVEPCINGRVVALGAYFGQPSDRLVDRLLGEQLADGGWNCEAERGSVRSSFHRPTGRPNGGSRRDPARAAPERRALAARRATPRHPARGVRGPRRSAESLDHVACSPGP